MNCFNIREVQTLLRSKYHPSFLDILEHHNLLEYTVIGLRFKLFGLDSINSNMFLSFEHSISKNEMNRDSLYTFTPKDTTFKSYMSTFLSWVNSVISDNLFFNNYQTLLNSLSVLNNLN